MDEYLLPGESVIATKGANFLLSLEKYGLSRFGEDLGTKLLGLHGQESLGGHLYLTNFRLFFRTHKLNRFTGTLSIFLPAIIETKNNSGLIKKIMEVITSDYTFEFIVWGIPKLVTDITSARDAITPAQSAALRIAVQNSPEKCGDGLKVFPPEMNLF
jgi:hypothetical protein